jgi:CDP-6-deoxy-D-xylo-4-hexulose-3-dehydrase
MEEKPAALMLVSVLGLSPQMNAIKFLCDKYEVVLLEDNCESQGTTFDGKKLGNFGLMSAFSTYFGHSMSTIEGGMVCTNNKEYYDLLLQLRSHGWDRDLDKDKQQEVRDENGINDFNAFYTFYVPAFNLRSTDLQAFLGLRQLDKIDGWLEQRNENFHYIKSKIEELGLWTPIEAENSWTASFCYPMIFKTKEQKDRVVNAMIKEGVECRPLISGSMGSQPMYTKKYGEFITPNVSEIDSKGMYMPNHPKLTMEEINKMISIIKENI